MQEYGFPVVSKLAAAKIARLQVPGDESPIIRAYMTGDMGAWGGFGHNEKFKLPEMFFRTKDGIRAEKYVPRQQESMRDYTR